MVNIIINRVVWTQWDSSAHHNYTQGSPGLTPAAGDTVLVQTTPPVSVSGVDGPGHAMCRHTLTYLDLYIYTNSQLPAPASPTLRLPLTTHFHTAAAPSWRHDQIK